jgi:hypothetical protein
VIQKYRKNPVEVEAVQIDYSNNDVMDSIQRWAGDAVTLTDYNPRTGRYGAGTVHTLEGPYPLLQGNFLVRGVAGEFYPCRGDIFAQTYESVDE